MATELEKQLAEALRLRITTYQAFDEAAAIRAADKAAHEALAAYAAQQSAPSEQPARWERGAFDAALDALCKQPAPPHWNGDHAKGWQECMAEVRKARAALAQQPAAGVALTDEQIRTGFRTADGMDPMRWMTAWQVWGKAVDWTMHQFGITAPAAQEKQG